MARPWQRCVRFRLRSWNLSSRHQRKILYPFKQRRIFFTLQPQDLALLMAHQYCVTHGLAKLDLDKVKSVCRSTLPPSAFVDGSKRKWVQMVYRTLKALAVSRTMVNSRYSYEGSKHYCLFRSKDASGDTVICKRIMV